MTGKIQVGGYGDNYDTIDWDDCVVELADGSKLYRLKSGGPFVGVRREGNK